MRYRIERDSLGEKIIPAEAYYGIHSLRSKETFEITKHGLCRQNIKALANIKKAHAKVNYDYKFIDKKKYDSIMLSCEEILNGRLHGQFITDSIQDGYGYGMNINACEVIANRANEMLGSDKGRYDKVSIEDVNLNQDNDEVVILAGKISTIRLVKKMITEGKKLANSFLEVIEKYEIEGELKDKMASFSAILTRDLKRLDKAKNYLLEIDYDSGANIEDEEMKKEYIEKVVKVIATNTTDKFFLSENPYDASRCLDAFMSVSSSMKNMMVNLSKSAMDLKKMVRNQELYLPSLQNIGRDEENLIVFDIVKQISYYTIGNDLTISRCVEDGDLDENLNKPMIFACMYESINLIRRTIRTMREKAIELLEVK